jgi:hypothetical protein
MYAFVVKNNQNTWDVWLTMDTIPIPHKEERLQSALASGIPIIGKNVTEHKGSVKNGAIWNGTEFIGGDYKEWIEGSLVKQYVYMCGNTIILILYGQPSTELNEKMEAIFESETTIIQVPEGQTAKMGDIWDGENIINQE